MRIILAVFLALCAPFVHAQLDVPVAIELTGSTDADRQVDGLASPLVPDAAVSVAAARATTMSYATASGTLQLVADLEPAILAYTPGMMITLVPNAANAAGATLELNGLGAQTVVKFGELPLDSADLPAGIPARLIYDGSRFLLLSNASRPCPTGFYAATSTYCIQDSSLAAITFFNAITYCHNTGARLCSMGEWANACRTKPTFIGTVISAEWVDSAANNSNDAKTIGAGWATDEPLPGVACNYGFTNIPTALFRFRCCMTR
ncbi:MAG: hypothetical protein KBA60_03975 [Flavobacteriales bacterium]|nr:hypothetical protein [Flavobacteriales bacterium]